MENFDDVWEVDFDMLMDNFNKFIKVVEIEVELCLVWGVDYGDKGRYYMVEELDIFEFKCDEDVYDGIYYVFVLLY